MTARIHTPGNILTVAVAHWAAIEPDEPTYTELRNRMQKRLPLTSTPTSPPPGNILAAKATHWTATRPDEPAYTELRCRMQERVPVTLRPTRRRERE